MKRTSFLRAFTILAFALTTAAPAFAADVRMTREEGKVRLSWPATMQAPGQGLTWPEFSVKRSSDLRYWTPIGGRLRGLSDRGTSTLSLTFDPSTATGFFRVDANTDATVASELGEGGAESFGYSSRFAEEIARLGFMSLDDFAASAPQPEYLPRLTWDPTTAAFWTNFYTNAAFRLNAAELEKFTHNGFVVSERLGNNSFGGIYYDIFHGDLPVFITADSILQAWHRTYLNLLEELEEVQLATLAADTIEAMASRLPMAWDEYGEGPLRESLLDADFFLAVARSLWAGAPKTPQLPAAGQAERVSRTLAAIDGLKLEHLPMFGSDRWVDFSQFQPRGHYTNSERLRRYFRLMMWCGRADFRLATFKPNVEDDVRQIGAAIVLRHLLDQSGSYPQWRAIEQTTRAFVGVTDSMTFDQLGDLLRSAGISSPADVPDRITLTNLQTRLLTGELGVQYITSDKLYSPLDAEELKLPRSFTVFGQRFVLDSWAFSQVVFDKVHWPSDNTTPYCGATNIFGKVVRRKPSCLDIAFSVFGNDQVAPEIIQRIRDTGGVPFRDGLPYQHNLTAVRRVISSQSATIWKQSIYTAWLAAIRALSAPTTGVIFPEAMRTRAWAMKNLNCQLASWTELRHDTVLYAKQSYTPPVICSYPYGFVEPRPEFWRAMRTMADTAASAISRLPASGQTLWLASRPSDSYPVPAGYIECRPFEIQQKQIAALNNFMNTMTTLESIASKELAQQPLSPTEEEFLISTMEYLGICHAGKVGYTGWYPGLFYQSVFWSPYKSEENNVGFHGSQGCVKFDALVTDVHTDLPDDPVCDPGAVLHQGVGKPHLLIIAVDNGPDRRVYAGPVFSHFEFEKPAQVRLTDEEWKAALLKGEKPAAPAWTTEYLAPSP